MDSPFKSSLPPFPRPLPSRALPYASVGTWHYVAERQDMKEKQTAKVAITPDNGNMPGQPYKAHKNGSSIRLSADAADLRIPLQEQMRIWGTNSMEAAVKERLGPPRRPGKPGQNCPHCLLVRSPHSARRNDRLPKWPLTKAEVLPTSTLPNVTQWLT